jgi:hypothetical protein
VTDHPLPDLYDNGAVNPNNWRPDRANLREPFGWAWPEPGDMIGWRYAAWRVREVQPVQDVDLTDEQRERLDASVAHLSPAGREAGLARNRPLHLLLRHVSGPLIIKDGEEAGFKRLHDGSHEISFTSWPHRRRWPRLLEPHRVCSCHGHVWACQDYDRTVLAAHQASRLDQLMATAQPGVCAHCLEVVTTHQRTITFPEESRYVPGAPGPTFHAGRAACWAAAEKYERDGRLADNPDVTRLASCPGVRFIHERHGMPAADRLECTAGPFCTGQHGPAGHRQDIPCWHQVPLAANRGAYARPDADCGYRGANGPCLGSDLSSGGSSISPTAADILWEQRQRARGRDF